MICWKIGSLGFIGGKLSLIYKENSYIFNLPVRTLLFVFKRGLTGQNKISAVMPPLEEELLQIDKRVFTYLS
jgi:hypothetical protein